MLVELHVSNLGVIEEQKLLFGSGLTALSGETGAGKTLLIDAIALLTGAPADPSLVRPGAAQAVVEGRFEVGEQELVVCRVVPASGRSRCYLDGAMVPLARLGELSATLVDIHGQHAHQSLLAPAAQRRTLDWAAKIDVGEVEAARRRVAALRQAQAELGGDPQSRARQLDLLRHQLRDITSAAVEDPDEDTRLQEEEEVLSDAAGLTDAAMRAWQALTADDGAVDRMGAAVAAASGRRTLGPLRDRIAALQEEASELAGVARSLAESIEADPGRLAEIGERRRALSDLRHKYGGTLEEVIAYRDDLAAQVAGLADFERMAAEVTADLAAAEADLVGALSDLRAARLASASPFAELVEAELHKLAMPRARFAVAVGEDPAKEAVTWMLAANPGQPLLPLAKVASGGELARAMLAARLVAGRMARGTAPEKGTGPGRADRAEGCEVTGSAEGPQTLVFDEVDAGIGGEAAVAVGRALAAIGASHQVLVVTHLAQVAACAGVHFAVAKEVVGEETIARATPLEAEARVVELARMLSGRPDSEAARRHAEELLES